MLRLTCVNNSVSLQRELEKELGTVQDRTRELERELENGRLRSDQVRSNGMFHREAVSSLVMVSVCNFNVIFIY